MKTWNVGKLAGNHQGIVYDEITGRDVALTYDPADAPLVAAAPAMLAALQEILADQETMCEPYRNEAICERIRAAIALAEQDPAQ